MYNHFFGQNNISCYSSHLTGPKFVATRGTMHGRIQRLLGEECCEWCQKLCRLCMVPWKTYSPRWDITYWLRVGSGQLLKRLQTKMLLQPCHCATSFVRMVVLNARGPPALLSCPHHNQVTWLDLGLLQLEAQCMEGYRDYWVKNAVSGAKNSAGLVRSHAKPPPLGKKLPLTWMETRSNAEGRSLTTPPPSKWTWADICIMRASTAPLRNKLTSPVKPRQNICWR